MSNPAPIKIFVPTYENVNLLRGLLASIHKFIPNSIVAVLDDSNSSVIRDYLDKPVKDEKPQAVEYYRLKRDTSTTYITCWNQAFAIAQNSCSEWFQIRHHDDHVIAVDCTDKSSIFQSSLISSKDLVISPVIKLIGSFAHLDFYRYHCHPFLIKTLLFLPPKLLYFYNFLGPTSSLYIKSSSIVSATHFDTSLRWLVDVNWYVKIINSIPRNSIVLVDDLMTISVSNNASITSQYFSGSRQEIMKEELTITCPHLTALGFFGWTLLATSLKILALLTSFFFPIILPGQIFKESHCIHHID